MRYITLLLCVLIFTFSFALSNAEAKRFGGGKSFGTQRSVNNVSRTQSMPQAAKPSMASKWLAPLAGLAIGGLLASLLMGNGIGTGILTWLAIGLGIYLLLSLFRKKTPLQTSGNAGYQNHFRQEASEPKSYNSNSTSQNNHTNHIPNHFDSESFLRDAKTKFLRLQTAYDQKNLNDLREFTTPEVYAEIQVQLHERGDVANNTEVVSLNTELLDAADEFNVLMASVRFSGLIREDSSQSGTATPFNEIWHFRKDNHSARWLVAGIQQNEDIQH
jgi:predicted lipid-binding transport protein (Tim44 family)